MRLFLNFTKRRFTLAACILLTALSGTSSAEEQEGMQVPTDMIRDVMQPMGVPVVTSYHAIRESIFLNTKTIDAHPIESIGNFFLTPSQYLFAGKKVIVKDEDTPDCEVVQAFHYTKLHWLKTLAALIVLPVSEVLGSTFKGLAYLSPEVRERHKKIKKALKSPLVKSHLEEYRLKGLPELYSDEHIPCKGHKRPSHLTRKQKIEIQALKDVVALLEAHNIVYWVDCGTCLGAYRYGGIIPWDWDIDLSIFMYDHDNVKKVLSTLDPEKYQIQDWSSYSKPKTFLKLYVKETRNFIDIYHYRINEEDKTVGYVFTYIDSPFPDSWKATELKCIKPLKYDEMFPLKKANFDNLIVRAPNNVVAFLQSKYGENLDPTMVWDEETKTYQKVLDHPYYQ
ncbi:MAG: LicD family protein [Verrucomicrobia bacterium]|nr:LicD family protein [Verrucomicrobiota bacterium]